MLNWNSWRDTIDCLNSLLEVEYPDFYPLIIDNASSDESIAQIKNWAHEINISINEFGIKDRHYLHGPLANRREKRTGFREVVLICSDINLGFCAGNNVGMRVAQKIGSQYFLILNNDTLMTPACLNELIKAAAISDDIGLVGGIICYTENPDTIWWAGGSFDVFLNTKRLYDKRPLTEFKEKSIIESEWISGCMMLIPCSIFQNIGGFDEQFFIWSEEWDFSIRVKKAGYRLVVTPQAKLFHKVGRALGVMSPLSYYYGIRNALLLKKKHLNQLLRWLYLMYYLPSRLIRYTQFAIQGKTDLLWAGTCAIRDYFLNRKGKWRLKK